MIFSLIFFLLIVIFMAFFIGKNLSNVCTLWIFKTYTNLPVAVLVLIAFGAGIVFSILLVLIFNLKKNFSLSAEEKVEEQKNKEQKKAERKAKNEEKLNKIKESQALKEQKLNLKKEKKNKKMETEYTDNSMLQTETISEESK